MIDCVGLQSIVFRLLMQCFYSYYLESASLILEL